MGIAVESRKNLRKAQRRKHPAARHFSCAPGHSGRPISAMLNSPRVPLSAARAGFSRALLAWYRVNARPLPWREVPSLYSTVVSEFMLQQTQVKTVLPYHARWLPEPPDFAALAAASQAQVLKLWEGLGYYSRVHNLQQVAQLVARLPEPP